MAFQDLLDDVEMEEKELQEEEEKAEDGGKTELATQIFLLVKEMIDAYVNGEETEETEETEEVEEEEEENEE